MKNKNNALNESVKSVCDSLPNGRETRSKRMQIVVKSSTFTRLEQLKQRGIIKSKNDLINNFLENFVQHYAEDIHHEDDQ